MNNEIDPAVGSWYQHLDDGRLFQVVAVDEDEESDEVVGTAIPAGGRPEAVEPGQDGRPDGLSSQRINGVKRHLARRREELRADILGELQKYNEESYAELAGRVADSGDRAFGDLVSDLNLAEVARDVDEVRGIEAAFDRLAEGKYGICVSCGGRIDRRRLEAVPTAIRCLECQRALERRAGEDRYPSL